MLRGAATLGMGTRVTPLIGLLLALIAMAGCASSPEIRQSAGPVGLPAEATAAGTFVPELVPTATTAPVTASPTSIPTPPLAALVDGRPIYLAEYERDVAQYEQSLLDQGLDPDTEVGQEQLAVLGPETLEGLIDQVLITQGAAELGIEVSDQELQAQVEADVASGGGQAAFEEWLLATGQTRDDYERIVRQVMLEQKVYDVVTGKVTDVADQAHARHIQVGSEAEAQEILALMREGGDFAALARERSLDLTTRDSGGDLGWFARGLVAPELEDAAFSLQPGEISDVIRLGEGYHLVQVMDREEGRRLSTDDQVDLKQAIFQDWLDKRKAAATIVRYEGQ